MTPEQKAVFNFQVQEAAWLMLDGGATAATRGRARRETLAAAEHAGRVADVLTVAALKGMIDALPPRETLVVSRMFPEGKALTLKTDRENFTCFGPETWEEVERAWAREASHLTPDPLRTSPDTFMGLRPFFMDERPKDQLAARYHDGERDRIMERIGKAWEKAFSEPDDI